MKYAFYTIQRKRSERIFSVKYDRNSTLMPMNSGDSRPQTMLYTYFSFSCSLPSPASASPGILAMFLLLQMGFLHMAVCGQNAQCQIISHLNDLFISGTYLLQRKKSLFLSVSINKFQERAPVALYGSQCGRQSDRQEQSKDHWTSTEGYLGRKPWVPSNS